MAKLEGSLILLLCLLLMANSLSQSRDPVRGFSIEDIQDNVPEKTAAGGYRKVPNRQRQTRQYPATTLTAKEMLETSSKSAIKYPTTYTETAEQTTSLNTVSKQTSQELQADGYIPNKPSLQSGTVNFNDIHNDFQEDPIIDKLTEYYHDHFKDEFICLPCQCYYSYNRSSMAFCQYTITEMNKVLPNTTQQLSVSHSPVRVFQAKDFLQYHSLQKLSVTYNINMSTIANNSYNFQMLALKWLDLNNNAVKDIMDRSFMTLPNLLSLNLSNNCIRNISILTFEGLNNLKFLNLSRNHLSILKAGTFDHYKKLELLDLSAKSAHLNFMTGVFSNLRALHTLNIHGNLRDAKSYPTTEIARLVNLTSLSIDGISSDDILGPEIKKLQRLVTLYVGLSENTECRINITQSFLTNVPYLETVRFSKCPLEDVDVNVYKNVPKLRSLAFIFTYPYDIFKALDGLRGLQNSSLKSLSLVGLISDGCPFICLYERDATYFSSLELEVIDLSDNRIAFMAMEFIHGLPQTLGKLMIRGNKLNEPALLTDKLFFLKHLETLDLGANTDPASNGGLSQTQDISAISKMQASRKLAPEQASHGLIGNHMDSEDKNSTYNTKLLEDQLSPGSVEEFMYTTNALHASPTCNEQFDQNRRKDVGTSNINDQNSHPHSSRRFITTQLKAPGLKYLLAPRYSNVNIRELFRYISQRQYTELTYVDFSFCALTSMTHFTDIPPWIQAINFQGTYFSRMQQSFSHYNNSLNYLSLNRNLLGNMFASNIKHVFKNLSSLIYLDLSMNVISQLDTNAFEGLNNLRTLLLKNNKLGLLNTNFSTTPKLEYLDLRKNSITWISKSTRDDLDIIATNHTLYVELTLNPLRCTCEGLEVLHWIWASNIHFVSKDTLSCLQDGGSVEYVGNIEHRVRSLQRQCAGKWLIIVLCVASVIVVCFLIVFGVVYRFRWRYMRRIALSRLIGFNPPESTSSYIFDAFIVYSDMSRQFVVGDCLQELEVKRGHKLCVDDRDFLPGTLSISAIVSAIQNSRKTVLILSPDFYDEEFSEYSVKMALMEEIYQNISILYLCVYRPLQGDEMSKIKDLMLVMKRNNYLEFPQQTETSEEVRQCFWDRLSEKIGSSVA